MYQGVGLVARSLAGGQLLRGQKRHPTVEDHVTIYANATIVGGETVIGEGSTIGASVFLTHSVPPHSLVTFDKNDVNVTNKTSPGRSWISDLTAGPARSARREPGERLARTAATFPRPRLCQEKY